MKKKIIALIIAATAVAIFFIYKNNQDKNSEENILSYTQLIDEVNKGNVEEIEMTAGNTNVKVKLKGTGGAIEIKFNDSAELDRFMQIIKNKGANL